MFYFSTHQSLGPRAYLGPYKTRIELPIIMGALFEKIWGFGQSVYSQGTSFLHFYKFLQIFVWLIVDQIHPDFQGKVR